MWPKRPSLRSSSRSSPISLAQLAGARHAAQDRLQALDVDRLHQVVGGAQAQRLDRALDAGVAGDQHHLGRLARLEVGDQVDALAVGQLQVGEQDVGLQARHVDARGAQRIGRGHGEAFGLGQLGQPLERFGIVVYEQEMGHFGSSGKGLQGGL